MNKNIKGLLYLYLTVIIKPIEGEILNADGGPLIKDLPPRAVDYMCDFIRNYEFKVLNKYNFSKLICIYLTGKFITQEKAISDLHSS